MVCPQKSCWRTSQRDESPVTSEFFTIAKLSSKLNSFGRVFAKLTQHSATTAEALRVLTGSSSLLLLRVSPLGAAARRAPPAWRGTAIRGHATRCDPLSATVRHTALFEPQV